MGKKQRITLPELLLTGIINVKDLCFVCRAIKLCFKKVKMMIIADRTFCASQNCKNKCGRKITKENEIWVLENTQFVSYGYFCDEKGEVIDDK